MPLDYRRVTTHVLIATVFAALIVSALSPDAFAVSTAEPLAPADKELVTDGHVVHDAGNLWNHVTNWGWIGASPQGICDWCDAPSARWPGEDGSDLLYAAGLWVGGRVLGENLVSTGAFEHEIMATEAPDDTIYVSAHGVPGGNRYPWPQANDDGDGLEDEDPLNNLDDDGDGLFDEDYAAVSDQHYRCVSIDYTAAGTDMYPDHTPLNLSVIQQSYQWSNPVAADFIGYDFTITNKGVAPIADMYLGLYSDFDVPAVQQGSGNDMAGYHEGDITASDGSVVPVRVAYMYDRDGAGSAYIGFVLCGHTIDPAGQIAPQEISVHSFQIFKGQAAYPAGDPTNDAERYDALQAAQHDPDSTPAEADDLRILLSSGPFSPLEPEASLSYQVALVAGEDFDGLVAAAAEAVLTYRGRLFDRDGDPGNGDEYRVHWLRWEDVPVAAASGRLEAHASYGAVEIAIQSNVEPQQGLTVVRNESPGVSSRRWSGDELAYAASTGLFRLVDDDPVGWPRVYDLVLSEGGRDQLLDRLELAAPRLAAPRLEVGPNPFNPRLEIDYALSRDGPVKLQVLDVRGRLVRVLVDEVRAAGEWSTAWGGDDEHGLAAPSSVYLGRSEAGGGLVEKRVTLVR